MTLMVAISTHKGYERYLETAIASALKHADIVKVYDDGGECEKGVWLARPSLKYLALPKTGDCIAARQAAVADAINLGTDWLLHLDADDWLLRRPRTPIGADIAYSDTYLCDDTGAIDGMWKCDFFPHEYEACIAFARERLTTPFPGKSAFRVAWLKEHDLSWYQWPSTTFAEDCRTLLEYLKHRPKVAYTPDRAHYVYRLHDGQDTQDPSGRAAFHNDLIDYIRGLE